MTKTTRLTMAQALTRFLSRQMTELGGVKLPIFGGAWAIFGHGIGEALYCERAALPTFRAHNEQAMTHAAIAYAKANFRRRFMAATTSIGPGAINMVTAAALAHVNRLPVLLLPGDVFATRIPDPVVQQAEAWDYPESFFAERNWTPRRIRPDRGELAAAVAALKAAKKPLIVAGGGVLYSGASQALVPASRSARRKAGNPRCRTIIASIWPPSASPAPRPPTGWPRKRMWCWRWAPGCRISPPVPGPCSRGRARPSSASTSSP